MLRRTDNTIDPIAVLRKLGLAEVGAIAPVTGGADTAIWRVERADTTYALRVFRPEQASACNREVIAMQTAAAGGIPVPVVHAKTLWHERPAVLLSWCPGRPILHYLLRTPWRAMAYGLTFGRMQAAIHRIAAPGSFTSGSWVDMIDPAETMLRSRLQQSDIRRDVLIHLDYHVLNVMADGCNITGVLDWTNARAGDPRADLARSKTILRLDMGRPGLARLVSAPLEPLWLAFERGWWRGYGEIHPPGDNLPLFYAAAGSMMERDLAKRYTAQQLAHVRRWTQRWKL
ncbi:MAG TPA: aminoglycoside phosphotransferase family protein [Chloroflexota bacterium]